MPPTEMHIDALMEKIEKLEAENARYREALERLAQEESNTCCECTEIKDICREALKGE